MTVIRHPATLPDHLPLSVPVAPAGPADAAPRLRRVPTRRGTLFVPWTLSEVRALIAEGVLDAADIDLADPAAAGVRRELVLLAAREALSSPADRLVAPLVRRLLDRAHGRSVVPMTSPD